MMKKKLFMLASCLILCLLTTASVFAADTSRSVEILSYEVEPGKNIYYYPAYGEITDCDDTITDLVIPSEINGVTITTIGRNAFAGNTSLENVTIPNTVTTIEIEAFYGCYNLNDITIPKSVTTIKDGAFWGCFGFENINIPDSVTYIGDSAFEHCNNATNVVLPNTLTKLNNSTFAYCYKLESISIPASVTTIGRGAFEGSGLKNIEIPGNVKTIEDYAFSSCNNLRNVKINNGVVNIYYDAFTNCEYLTTITLPASINYIAANDNIGGIFAGCWRLTEIIVDNDNEIYASGDGILFSKDQTALLRYPEGKRDTSYTIPNTITEIERNAFSGCEYLKDIYYSGSEYQWQHISTTSHQNIIIPETTTVHCLGASVTGIKLNQTELVLPIGGTAQLIATVEPENAACKGVQWQAANGRVKVDDNGLITARSAGTVNVLAITYEGKFVDECKVTVIDATSSDTPAITISPNIRNGHITVSPTMPSAGQTVIVNVIPDTSYRLDELTAKDQKGNGLEITKITDTKYSFVMPKGQTTLNATFVKLEEQPDNTYVLTLDANGGYIVKASVLTQYVPWGSSYKLPIATRNGYTLQGWNDGTNTYNASTAYVVNHDTRLIALWQQNNTPSGGGSGNGSSGGGGGGSKPAINKPDTTKPNTTTPNAVTADNINKTFADVSSNAWYAEYIAYVYNKGMMKGTENGNFEPNAKTTRGMIVTMLYRLEGEPNTGNAKFNDVTNGQWFSNAVAWASANGVVNGYADGTFAPNGDITREQLAAILYRYAQVKGYDISPKGDVNSFFDSNKISGWANEYMQWAVGSGIINGDNNALKPAGDATRAEVAMMLMRFIEKQECK